MPGENLSEHFWAMDSYSPGGKLSGQLSTRHSPGGEPGAIPGEMTGFTQANDGGNLGELSISRQTPGVNLTFLLALAWVKPVFCIP